MAKQIDKEIGARIRARRNVLGLSQERLGDELGLTFQQVQKYEKGTNRVSGSRLVHLCSILKTSPNELCGFEAKSALADPVITAFLARSGKNGLAHLEAINAMPLELMHAVFGLTTSVVTFDGAAKGTRK